MGDAMLSELYERAFQTKKDAEVATGVNDDRQRQVALVKNKLLAELINIRIEQIRRGE
jgi:hypothetical protein